MDAIQTLYFLASILVTSLPQLIVIIGGIVLCFINWAKNPKVGKIALIGLVIMLLMNLAGVGFTFVQVQLPLWYRDSVEMIGYINVTARFTLNLVWTIGLGLLIYSVWLGREKG